MKQEAHTSNHKVKWGRLHTICVSNLDRHLRRRFDE